MVVLNKALLHLAGIVRKLIENTMIGFCYIRLSILGTLLENPLRAMYSLCFNNADIKLRLSIRFNSVPPVNSSNDLRRAIFILRCTRGDIFGYVRLLVRYLKIHANKKFALKVLIK